MKLLARVEDFFQLGRHDLILLRFASDDGRIRVQEPIQLRTPDGKIVDTYVAAIGHTKYSLLTPGDPYVVEISLPPEITKEDVPPGTQVWNFKD